MSRPPDLRHKDPEVRKDRVKLLATGLSAVGLALLIGSAVGPLVDPSKYTDVKHLAIGFVLGGTFIVAALSLLHYIVPRRKS